MIFHPRLTASSLALVLSASVAYAQDQPHDKPEAHVAIEHAEIVLSPGGVGMAAGYLSIWNGSSKQASLVAVRTNAFRSSSLHKTVTADGVARMRPVDGPLEIPLRAELKLMPGGLHVMFADPLASLKPGDYVEISAVFADGTQLKSAAKILAAGSKPTDHHHGDGDGASVTR